jgi:hypothetical protein
MEYKGIVQEVIVLLFLRHPRVVKKTHAGVV